MKKSGWKSRIRKACQSAGTYREAFDHPIDTLADILAKRDAAQSEFDADGGEILISYENKGGGVNKVPHPALKLVNEMNRDALAYWRDLGLTPAGLRKINEDALRKRASPLSAALKDIGKA